MNYNKNKITTIIVFILTMSVFIFTATIEYNRNYQNSIKETQDELYHIKQNFENVITARMIAINGLKAHIELYPNLTQDEFNYFARAIFASNYDVVQSMSFVTDTTITHIYPYDKYKNVIGTDLATKQDQEKWIEYAKEFKKSIITAPVELVEGGNGIVVRIPIERQGEYYGQASIVFNYDKTLEACGMVDFSTNNFVELEMIDTLTKQNNIMWNNFPDNIKESKEIVFETVDLYDSQMLLQSIPKNGFNGKSILFYLILSIGWIISIIASLMVYKLLGTTMSLRDSKKDLVESNEELEAYVNQLKANEEELHKQYEEINEKNEYIQFLADRDYLTNLFNRRKFTNDLTSVILTKDMGTVLLLDIDNFKNINDTQGHHYGDKVLSHIGKVLKNSISETAVVYRIGGDEFAIHLPKIIDNNIIEDCMTSFFEALKTNNFIEQIKNNITASVGIAKYPQDSISADDILIKTDIAMYKSKEEGKNRFSYFSQHMIANFDNLIKIENQLQDALDIGNFKLVYQPIVDSGTGEISYFEALLRIKDSFLSPAEFIPVAENTGLIIPIGNWVIDEVCRQLSVWRENGISLKPVAINISAKQLYEGTLTQYIQNALKKYDISYALLEIEITESVLIEKSALSVEQLNELKNIGIPISLDDFGTGYSSLSYLTYIPFDKVKIDKSLKDKFLFLENFDVMQGIISLSHGLNLKVVTEGVETLEEFNQLKIHKSDFVQGFYFSKPVEADKVIDLITKKYI